MFSRRWRPRKEGRAPSSPKVGDECFTWGLYAKSGYSQLQLQSFTMGRTTGVIEVSGPPSEP